MKFSVIIPTYNRSIELKNALISLENQNFKDFEVLICDDGSTDNTKEIVESFKNTLNLKYLHDENWGGPAKPRNVGIKNATTDWICFLDSDDSWYPNKLMELNKVIQKKDYDVYYHFFRCGGKKIGNYTKPFWLNHYDNLLINGNQIVNSSLCIKKSKLIEIKGFKESKNLIAIEDYDLLIRLAQIKSKFHLIKKTLGFYNLGDNNISSNFFKQYKRMHFLLNSHYIGKTKAAKKQALLYYMTGAFLLTIQKKSKASKYFFSAIKNGSIIIKFKSFFRLIKLLFKVN